MNNPPSPLISPSSAEEFSSASRVLKESLKIYKNRLITLLGIAAIPLVIFLTGTILYYFFDLRILFIPFVLVRFFFQLLVIPAIIYNLRENLGIKESYKNAIKILFSYIWISILTTVIIVGGYGLLIVPGIIFSVWFSLPAYVLIFEEKKGMNALLRSKHLIFGRWWGVFWRLLVLGVISFIIIFIPFLFLTLITGVDGLLIELLIEWISYLIGILITPFSIIYLFLIYQNLKRIKPEISYQEPPRKTKIKYILIGILGIIIFIALIIGLMVILIRSPLERARDAQRLADVRQLAFILEKEAAFGTTPLTLINCTTADALTTTCIGPGQVGDFFPEITDPGDYNNPCTTERTANCAYAVSRENGEAGAQIDDYQICFFLEVGAGGMPAGLHSIVTGSRFREGCF